MDQPILEEYAQIAAGDGLRIDPGDAGKQGAGEACMLACVTFQLGIAQFGQKALFTGKVVSGQRCKIQQQVLDVCVAQSGVGVDLKTGSGGEQDQLSVLGVECGVANAEVVFPGIHVRIQVTPSRQLSPVGLHVSWR